MSEIPPVFLVGCPRSGTTMLAGLLRQTQWGAPFETQFILKYLVRLHRYGDLSVSKNMQRLLRDILKERPVQQWWDTSLDVREFCESLHEPTYQCLLDTFCRRRIRQVSSPSWGDKTPHYVLDLERLSRLFPESKFIVIVRDGRDVALSLLAKSWGPSNIASCAQYWAKCVERRPIYDELMAKDRLVEVRYEDLLANPGSELSRVLDCLGVNENREDVIATVTKVDRNNKDKWRKKMSVKDQAVFQQVAGVALKSHGYDVDPTLPRVAALTLTRYNVHERIAHVLQLVRANTIDAFNIKFRGAPPFAD